MIRELRTPIGRRRCRSIGTSLTIDCPYANYYTGTKYCAHGGVIDLYYWAGAGEYTAALHRTRLREPSSSCRSLCNSVLVLEQPGHGSTALECGHGCRRSKRAYACRSI
jgi:hypothetical protein